MDHATNMVTSDIELGYQLLFHGNGWTHTSILGGYAINAVRENRELCAS